MKWFCFTGLLCLAIIAACTNSEKAPAPGNNRVADTSQGRSGDTSSYERMPQKITDSMDR